MGDTTNAYRILLKILRERNHLEDLGVDGDNIEINLQEMRWRGMD
jgi:hypothetical protein